MKININIDDELIAKAKKLTGIQSESIIVEKALQLFISIKNQEQIRDLIGKIQFDDDAFK